MKEAVYLLMGLNQEKISCKRIENGIKKKFNSKYCLAVSSGTSAIKISLKSLGVQAW